jgi:ABC-type spermidine/putrescine transport system permease subunit I
MRTAKLRGLLMVSPPILVIAMFIGFPVVWAVLYTFGHTGGLNSVVSEIGLHQFVADHWWGTIGAYKDVFQTTEFWRSMLNTVVVTVFSTVIVLVLGGASALYLRLSGSRLAKALSVLGVVPLFIPVVISSYAILVFYSPDGFFRSVAHLVGWENAPVFSYTMIGVTVGQVWVGLPFSILLLSSAFAAVPDALIDAARDAGAPMSRVVRSVVLPMSILPAVIVATFTAIGVLGSFTVPYLIGPSAPNMLGPEMANTFGAFNQPQQAEVMAVVLFLLAVAAGVNYVRANFRASRQSGANS